MYMLWFVKIKPHKKQWKLNENFTVKQNNNNNKRFGDSIHLKKADNEIVALR